MFDLHTLARALDAAPLSPRRIGEHLVRQHSRARERAAAQDPTWAQIESQRQTGRGTVTFLSDELDLSHWQVQQEIAENRYPDRWWLPIARTLQSWSVSDVTASATALVQRAQRGYSDGDVHELGYATAQRTGQMLLTLAQTAHGWPGNASYPTFEDWTAALRMHGRILSTLGDPDGQLPATLDAWHEIATTPGHDRSREQELLHEHQAAEQAAQDAVRTSLHWVAENWTLLWD